MKKWLLAGFCFLALAGCGKERLANDITAPAPIVVREEETSGSRAREGVRTAEADHPEQAEPVRKEAVKVKGIYLTAPAAGSPARMDEIIEKIGQTELNAVVIDFKDDQGRITCRVDSPVINEIEACQAYIEDMPALMKRLKENGIYTIARIVAFRDPYLAEKKPEWCMKLGDGTVFRDSQGLAWIDPYKQEVWEYLAEVGEKAAECGFDEVQFDYIRFCTERGVDAVVFDEEDRQGRSKTDAITQFTSYIYEKLSSKVYVAADVFGGVISSRQDGEAVGQLYAEMAECLDYICPMIYPSHYGNGYFGIEYPDMEPYATVRAALKGSAQELGRHRMEGERQAAVRPWLQDFTASYLEHHIEYGKDQIRAQIQAVYDAGYDEWILWNAASQYTWDGLKTAEEAEAEAEAIAQSRAALSEEERETAGFAAGEPETSGPPPELTEMPELPEYVEPAGGQESEEEESVGVVIPQMRME